MSEHQYETRAARRARKKVERSLSAQGSSRWWLWVVGVVVVGVAIIAWPRTPKTPADLARAHQNLLKSCVTHSGLGMHIHPHLTIVTGETELAIPANVGITNTCLHPIHTHDGSGIIHLESHQPADFTLGDFFQVWDASLTTKKIADRVVADDEKVTLFVDGVAKDFSPDMVMKDHMSIALVISKKDATVTPPANYVFTE